MSKLENIMQKVQNELVNIEVTGESGAGLVEIIMTGRHDAKKTNIDDSLFTSYKIISSSNELESFKNILEELITSAINDAVKKIENNLKNRMNDISQDMNISQMFKSI
jgi:DNA-binding YbaB/EbfC family protein